MNIPFRSYWMSISLLTLLGQYLPNQAMMCQPSPDRCTSYTPSTKLLFTIASTAFLAGITSYLLSKKPNHTKYYWNWDSIDTTKTKFPADFMWGIGTSAHQVEGNCTNNTWSEWEKSYDEQGNSRVKEQSGIACDQWNRYKEDVQLIKELGVDAYRFSVEWSKIEPCEGQFNEEALAHYKNLCNELIANGIKPIIGFHHYTDPLWFAEKGGFEKEENIPCFVRFCTTVFEHLKDKGHLWSTFNSPSGYAAKSYLNGINPPGKKNMQTMIEVLKNMMEAHVQVYQTLKEVEPNAQIGLLKNIYQLDPWNPWNPLDRLACFIGNLLINESIYKFFTTGTFYVYIPCKAYINHYSKDALQSLDFIGLNYYSHTFMQNFKPRPSPDEISTDNKNYTIYPEGLYRAIQEISHAIAQPLNIPIYVTENGVATNDDNIRNLFLDRYLYALSKARSDGYNVRGYIHWSLLDNYEWGSYDKKYGLYAVDRTTLERTLKPAGQYFIDTVKSLRQVT